MNPAITASTNAHVTTPNEAWLGTKIQNTLAAISQSAEETTICPATIRGVGGTSAKPRIVSVRRLTSVQ